MTTEKMNVHKALSELKILGSKIDGAMHDVEFVACERANVSKINGKPANEWKAEVTAAYDKVNALLKRRTAIKRAVIRSNATTLVSINGVEYTVAEAIEMKNNGVTLDEQFANVLSRQYISCMNNVNLNNGARLDSKVETHLSNMFGGAKESTDPDIINRARQSFIESNTYELYDPIHAKVNADALNESCTDFLSEVDSALSTSNAVTEIEITY